VTGAPRTGSLRATAGWRVLEGFGGADRVAGRYAAPESVPEVLALLARAREEHLKVALRGSGRSYGDAAFHPQGLTLDLRGLSRILAWDAGTGLLEAEPGVTLGAVWRHVVADGYWPAVVPGTQAPTLGACLAMDVHGKNHLHAGTFGEHVEGFTLATPDGRTLTCSRQENADVFHAAIGGLGLLGVVTRVRLKLRKVASGRVRVRARRAGSLAELFGMFRAETAGSDHLVAWVDASASGHGLGRGVLELAHEPRPGEDPLARQSLSAEALAQPMRLAGVPRSQLWRLIQPWMTPQRMRLLSRVRFEAARVREGSETWVPRTAFNFQLDSIPDWRRAYGPDGFLQFQAFVPDAEAEACFRDVLAACHARGMPGFLGVLKRHRPAPFLLTYALDGWSLALDFPAPRSLRPALLSLLRELTNRVLAAGGRFYFAKDSILTPADVERAWDRQALQSFAALKRRMDPDGVLEHALARRALQPWLPNHR
jgi:decaprenylphospho-beta-D-ribofuranose 2-oxidase